MAYLDPCRHTRPYPNVRDGGSVGGCSSCSSRASGGISGDGG